jgi:LacI family transcriptional regulator
MNAIMKWLHGSVTVKKRKKISQIVIAQKLGVSQSLVSIVLNGRKEGIAEKTYKRIWDYAMRHGYSPKGMILPDGIELESSNVVGYILQAPYRLANQSPFINQVTQGLHEYLSSHDVDLLYLGSEAEMEGAKLDSLKWKRKNLKGIVIIGEVEAGFLDEIGELRYPVVYICGRNSGYCHSVNANEIQAGEQLAEHLVSLGYQRFAYIGPSSMKLKNLERVNGIREILAKHNLELPDEQVLLNVQAGWMGGFSAAEELLKKNAGELPIGLICGDSVLARGAIASLRRDGASPGKTISVVAFDNTVTNVDEVPGITGAHSDPEFLGREAAKIILENKSDKIQSMHDIVLPSVLSVRESSTGRS